MRILKNASINRKLTLLVMAAVAVALLLSYTAFVIQDVRIMRGSMVSQLSALADVLGSNSVAAVTFDDDEAARQVLRSLRMQPTVEAACIYDAHGSIFATYLAKETQSSFPPLPEWNGHEFTGGSLQVAETITTEEGEAIGTIYLRASLTLVHEQILVYAAITASVMFLSFVAAYLIATRLQRAIAGPILALASTAKRISNQQDYSVRVQKTSDDELGILYDQFNRMLEQVQLGKRELQKAHDELEVRVQQRTSELSETNRELSKEVTERRRAERKLEQMHGELVLAARRAGMAEIATGVLHNVGNVLNSVNVAANMVAEELHSSRTRQLMSVATMVEEQGDRLADFLTNDERGKQIPAYLKLIAEAMLAKEKKLMEELEDLTGNVEHIKNIVATQQSYTQAGGMVEPMDVATLLDDAAQLNSSSFERHHIRVVREYQELPPVLLDKQRILQIMINLVKNAKEALVEQQDKERVLTLRIRSDEERLIIEVSDTGSGIKKEDLTRVFSHGFTTKAAGHGFGLHSSANAAAEMDGSLTAFSDGPMQGATFRLSLPLALAAPVEANL